MHKPSAIIFHYICIRRNLPAIYYSSLSGRFGLRRLPLRLRNHDVVCLPLNLPPTKLPTISTMPSISMPAFTLSTCRTILSTLLSSNPGICHVRSCSPLPHTPVLLLSPLIFIVVLSCCWSQMSDVRLLKNKNYENTVAVLESQKFCNYCLLVRLVRGK